MTTKLGRPYGVFALDADTQLWLADNWATMPPRQLAQAVGLSWSGLYKYKNRLNLPTRSYRRPTESVIRRSVAKGRKTREQKVDVQLARLEVALAKQRAKEIPPIRRCPICEGIEYVATPHQHAKAA